MWQNIKWLEALFTSLLMFTIIDETTVHVAKCKELLYLKTDFVSIISKLVNFIGLWTKFIYES